MRTVVAGVDLTVMGRRVADRARLVAETVGTPLTLLHILEPVAEAFIDPSHTKLMHTYQAEKASELAEWCQQRAEVEVRLEVVKGSPGWEMVSAGKSHHLTVIGSSTIDTFAVGPTARRVARMSTNHFLMVRRQPRVAYRRVMVGVDFSDASRVAVDTAFEMFPDAEFTLAYTLPSRFDPVLAEAGLFPEELDADRGRRLEVASDRMAEFVHDLGRDCRHLILDGSPLETIGEAVRRRNVDLLVVGSRGAGATRMVLLGSVAEGLLASAPCDVMVARVPSVFRRP